MKQRGPALAAGAIDRLELAVGATLPGDYRRFLEESNGGVPEACVFDIPGQGRDEVREFLCLGGDAYSDLLIAIDDFSDRIPAGMMPVAVDDLGNVILLALSGPGSGTVYFWDHEREGDSDGIVVLAPSFSGFLASLRPT